MRVVAMVVVAACVSLWASVMIFDLWGMVVHGTGPGCPGMDTVWLGPCK